MLKHYKVNVAGPTHDEKGIPCQDSCAVELAPEGKAVIAAVADGLGSESRSDVGSQTAATTFVTFCKKLIGACAAPQDITALMRRGYAEAYDAVLAKAEELGELADQFDSTLCAAIFDGSTLYWGQSGDSGLVACMDDGGYRLVTTMQRDEEGRVFPLCADDHWEFGALEDVRSIMLCTDGVLEGLFAPPILAANGIDPVNRAMARAFLNPTAGEALDPSGLEVQAERFLLDCPKTMVDDDKTVVVVFDDERLPVPRDDAYYAEPDWEQIHRELQARLYAPASAGNAKEPSAEETPLKTAPEPQGTAPRDAASQPQNSPASDQPPRPKGLDDIASQRTQTPPQQPQGYPAPSAHAHHANESGAEGSPLQIIGSFFAALVVGVVTGAITGAMTGADAAAKTWDESKDKRNQAKLRGTPREDGR